MKVQTLVLLGMALVCGALFFVQAPVALAQSFYHDAFASPLAIETVPFVDTVDMSLATREDDEPVPSCTHYYFNPPPAHTVWYSFMPENTVGVVARSSTFNSMLAVYTVSELNQLTEIGCNGWFYDGVPLLLTGGTRYLFQVSAGESYDWPYENQLTFRLELPPPLEVYGPSIYPEDPSIYDRVEFNVSVYDSAGFTLTYRWDFGDGATGDGSYLFHQYAADGDYLVSLDVTSEDGRSAHIERTLAVRTHDVLIQSLRTQAKVQAGQTRQVSIVVKSARYDEEVEVRLSKSVPGGTELINYGTQTVLLRNKTGTEFVFNYTYTAEDAALGKVTFVAEALLVNGHDALPADNAAISKPVQVQAVRGAGMAPNAEEDAPAEEMLDAYVMTPNTAPAHVFLPMLPTRE